jgi:hypothetical protein
MLVTSGLPISGHDLVFCGGAWLDWYAAGAGDNARREYAGVTELTRPDDSHQPARAGRQDQIGYG